MKNSLPVLLAASSLILAPGYALAQHVDVGPGGIGVHGPGHGDRHGDRHEHVEHDRDRHVDRHHDDHHGGSHESTTVERHRH